jgi:hypothetical protein
MPMVTWLGGGEEALESWIVEGGDISKNHETGSSIANNV